mmetsp:Transcript_51825/g.160750  ORF Transcript_51825/g.160750 Transcript_51825/m.160750 type:complete len:463 (+) Transcript_51825:92-1480(+)
MPEDEEVAAGEAAEKENVEEEVPLMSPEQAEEYAKYDLTSRITPFLDRHMIFPILHFLQKAGMYRREDLTKAEITLLSDTSMLDAIIDNYAAEGNEPPQDLLQRRDNILQLLEDSQRKVLKLLQVLENDDQVRRIAEFKTLGDLCSAFELEPDIMEEFSHYAKLHYQCGHYPLTGELLKHYRSMIAVDAERPMSAHINCIWGSLASFILNEAYDEAAEFISKLDEYLESSTMPKKEVLLHRTWLLHWTLFVIFRADKVEQKLLDYLLNDKSLSIISLAAPHLFRYVGAVLILHKRLKHLVKDTVWILHHEGNSYSDPVTRFLLALYTDMDFDQAQHELQLCSVVCKGDYFLAHRWAEFEENARLLIFETYCRIHQCINIRMIASKLNMEAEEAELWIVKLIQNAKLDARIDSEKSRVVMSKAPPSIYQQVIEKTKNLAFRSTMLLSNLEKREKDRLAGGAAP